MFDTTLLDSSPARVTLLTPWHWVSALLVGALGCIAAYLVLPLAFTTEPKGLVLESILLGIAIAFYELMLWYVLADARRLGFSVSKWAVILLLLNAVGFVIYLIYSAAKTGDWKRAALPIAYILEGVVVIGLLLIPLINTQALPAAFWRVSFFPQPPPASRPATPRVSVARGAAPHAAITAPRSVPTYIWHIKELPDSSQIVAPDIASLAGNLQVGNGSGASGIPFGFSSGTGTVPPPPISPKVPSNKRVQVGGVVQQSKLIFGPSPEYPPLAKMARIQGTVKLQAVISKEGTIQDLRLVSGPPLLVKASLDAVARWRYQPTLLNGEPVEVITEIDVNFKLSE